jgi:hypothetical protein
VDFNPGFNAASNPVSGRAFNVEAPPKNVEALFF